MGTNQKFKTFEIVSENGTSATLTDLGARLMSLKVADRNGVKRDVLLGFDRAEEYVNDHGTYFGAVVGRVANRIGGGRFELGGKLYKLALNDNGVNHLHGGEVGFDKRVWEATELGSDRVSFEYVSPDGEEGYPGELGVKVVYTVSDDGIRIEYFAKSDRDTLCALTNHAYFNLDGDGDSVLDHKIFIDSDSLTVVDKTLIPTGERLDLTADKNAAYAFLRTRRLGEYLGKGEGGLIEIANAGYDFSYNFVGGADRSKPRAVAHSVRSGITMQVFTDLPAMQFYTGNFLDGFKGKGGKAYQKHAAFCMETQCDISDIKQRALKGGQEYRSTTEYRFCVE